MACRHMGWSRGSLVGFLFAATMISGCGANDAPGTDYSGTWNGTLDNNGGSFVMVIAGNAVTNLSWSFSYSASSGGSSCSITSSCPASGSCATPKSSSVGGLDLSVAKTGTYEITGTFGDASSATGDIKYQISASSALCNTTQDTTWTAAKS